MTILMNSAMMPQPGQYRMYRIDRNNFAGRLREAHGTGVLVSYIGYQQTAEFITKITGVPVEVNRTETKLQDGDFILVCKLKYRVDARTKGAPVDEDDFEFFRATYSENPEY